MFHFFQAHTLSINPAGVNASIDYFYKSVTQNISLSFNRGGNMTDNVETAKALSPITMRQIMVILKFSMSCLDVKLWVTGRVNIAAYAVDFYKIGPDLVTPVLIGTKVLAPKRSI